MAEKLGTVRQDPDLHGLLFTLISRATGGRHASGARGARRSPLGDRERKGVKAVPYVLYVCDLFYIVVLYSLYRGFVTPTLLWGANGDPLSS